MDIAKLSTTPQKPISKRLWHIIRAVYYMLYKGISKQKLIIVLNLRLLSCRHADPTRSFYVPREVEFSCSNTPIFFQRKKMKRYDQSAKEIARAFEMLDYEKVDEDSFCFHGPSLSPIVLKEDMMEGENVDKEAEDFIRRFYQQLRSQQQPLLGRA